MSEIKKELTTTLKIYREFFIKAEQEVKNQLEKIKSASFCKSCYQCCKVRYSELSPEELKKMGHEKFLDFFIPIGLDNNNNNIDIKTNQINALNVDRTYVENIIKNTNKDCWFYTCKYYKNNSCTKNKKKPLYCTNYPQVAYQVLHNSCGFINWQKNCLDKLENQMGKDILEKINDISNYKNNFSCNKCATCCKLACSEFSYEELKEKAKNGDNFAIQFTSIFIPYENEEDAYLAYSEYIDYLRESLPEDEKVYFYYCPKNKNNLCTDYTNRPKICSEFPTNPLMILPSNCGYRPWRDETHTATLLLHALVDILDFYIKRLKKITNDKY